MTVSQSKILGGAFGLETPNCSVAAAEPPFAGPHVQCFLNVRSALKALCEVHRPASAWLPSYLCASLLEAFEVSDVTVRYYPVDGRFRCSDDSFLEEIRPGDFLLVIHYFGFPSAVGLAENATSKGAIVIEDGSQALFLKQQFSRSTCILYSPRKFVGVPDAGIMVSTQDPGTAAVRLAEPPRDWWKLAVATSLQRRDFDLTGLQNDWFPLFQRTERDMPIGSYCASDLSATLLFEGIDYQSVRARRRDNYARLSRRLGEYALFPELETGIVPLGFPVRVTREIRDSVLLHLHRKNIFAPMHWPIEGLVPASFRDSHELAQSSLTLVCDQRCGPEDMDRQAKEFQFALMQATHGRRS